MRAFLLRKSGQIASLLVIFVSLSFYIAGCSDTVNEPVVQDQQVNMLTKDNPQLRGVIAAQEKYTPRLMNIPDVVGTAVSLTADGVPCVVVFAKNDIRENARLKGIPDPVPDKLDNLPVEVWVTGEFKAFKTSGVSHKAKQTPPIQLGTSGGWRYDLANGYCCGGTLGSLINMGGKICILSNYHVFESDIVNGGNSRTAQTNDPIIQPGLIEVGCNAANTQNVALLIVKKTLPSTNVDASVAEIITGMVRTDGAILEVGTLSSQTIAASVNQKVKKSGRTTGLTRSTVAGLNASVSVTYDNECAGGFAFTKTFTGQIVINNRGSKFLAGGDSGSLMVQDVTTNPKAVGLLFAGSSSYAIANPISEVLSELNATMVGN